MPFRSVSVPVLLSVWNGFARRLVLLEGYRFDKKLKQESAGTPVGFWRTWVVLLQAWMPVLRSYADVFASGRRWLPLAAVAMLTASHLVGPRAWSKEQEVDVR